ncbi:MAG: PRC-barrel domain-containing protein [Allosphingosinicella sp.]|uniref:PRC-barrel domain-containing protein n=1 Tax=Allosphingosinicella sp. TaxID=2823234 RepID=UPI0039566FB6
MADRRYRDDDRGGSGWTEDIDRNRSYGRSRSDDYGRGRDSRSMFGSNWRDRDDQLERDRGGWGDLWDPHEDRRREQGRSRAWSHDEDRSRSRRGDEHGRHRPWDDERERYGPDDRRRGLPIDETDRLIASNKVEGTAVYGLDGDRLGSVYNFMVDKYSGKVEYAVMSYGGFLGMGTRYYPLPWKLLKYDTRIGGYRVEMTHRDLERAPSFDRGSEPRFDTAYGERVHGWYGLSY